MNQGLMGAFAGMGQGITETAQMSMKDHLERKRMELQARIKNEAPSAAAKQQKELVASGMNETQARNASYGIKAEKKEPLIINNQIVDPETGDVLGDYRDPESASGGGGQAPADVRTAEWMVANGMAPNLDVAFNRVNESRTDPARFVNDFVTQEMKFQENSGLFPGDENYRTPEQMREQAVDTLAMIRSKTRGGGSQPQGGSAKPGGLIGSSMKVLPEDGSAVPQADGSYTGRVNRSPESQAPQPQSQSKTPVVRSDEDYERLPPGTVFVDEEGNRFQKPAE